MPAVHFALVQLSMLQCSNALPLLALKCAVPPTGSQNRESMEKVAQLCSSKQRLSKSLHDARVSDLSYCMDAVRSAQSRWGALVPRLLCWAKVLLWPTTSKPCLPEFAPMPLCFSKGSSLPPRHPVLNSMVLVQTFFLSPFPPLLMLQLDKEGLQSTIRQLTAEAALLAEQARHALLPSAAPSPRSVSECLQQPAQQEEEVLPNPCGAPAAQEPSTEQPVHPAQAEQPADKQEQPGRPDQTEFQMPPEQAEKKQVQGLAEQTGLGQGQERASAATSAPGASQAAAAAAAYVQAGGGSGDKRRRVAPDLLLDVPCSPDECSAGEENGGAEGSASSPRCRLPTPGETPKRKPRRSSINSGAASTGTAPVNDTVPAAAEDPAVEPPVASATPPRAVLQQAATVQQADAAGPAASCAIMQPPLADELTNAAFQAAVAEVVEELEWETFQLFDQKWFGSSSCSSKNAVRSQRGLSRLSASGGGCAMM